MAVGVQYYKVILRHTVRSQRNFRNFPTVIDRMQVASSNCTKQLQPEDQQNTKFLSWNS